MINTPSRAVRFGDNVDFGIGSNQCFPFYYNFVNSEEDEWEANKGAATAGNLTGIGPAVAPGATIDHTIQLDTDYNFMIEFFRYTVYWLDTVNGLYTWYEPIVGFFLNISDYQTQIGTPLTNSIQISVFLKPRNYILMGGQNLNAIVNNAGALVPVPVSVIQGYDYGYGQVITPFFMSYDSQIVLQITNTHTIKTLYVGGIVGGKKVRI